MMDPPPRFFNLRNAEVGEDVDASDVHHEAAVPGGKVGFKDGAERMNRSGVDKNVESAGRADGFREDAADLVEVSGVTGFDLEAGAVPGQIEFGGLAG